MSFRCRGLDWFGLEDTYLCAGCAAAATTGRERVMVDWSRLEVGLDSSDDGAKAARLVHRKQNMICEIVKVCVVGTERLAK